MSDWQEIQTQNLLKGLSNASGLDPPGGAGIRFWGEGRLKRPAEKWMDGWMVLNFEKCIAGFVNLLGSRLLTEVYHSWQL